MEAKEAGEDENEDCSCGGATIPRKWANDCSSN